MPCMYVIPEGRQVIEPLPWRMVLGHLGHSLCGLFPELKSEDTSLYQTCFLSLVKLKLLLQLSLNFQAPKALPQCLSSDASVIRSEVTACKFAMTIS